ncbi:MAG: hypothetical protein ACTIJJ_02915 [Galactobacter sp.]
MSTSDTPSGNNTPSGSGPQQARPTPGAPWGETTPGEPTGSLPPVLTGPPVLTAPPGPPDAPGPQVAGPTPPKRRVPLWVYWVVGAVVLALVAGTVVYFLVRNKDDGGASSPAKAAAALERNVADKDVMALASQVAPSEYAPYAQNFAALLKDSGLHKAITGKEDRDPVSALSSADDILDAVDVKRSKLNSKVSHQGKHLAAVDVTSWDLDFAVNREAMEKALKKVGKQQGADSVESMLQDLRDASDEDLKHSGDIIEKDQPLRLVMVKEESGWYLSPVLTGIESSRLADVADDADGTSAPEPDWDADPTTSKGASSPDKAFSDLIDNLLDAKSVKDLYADPVVSRLALPERRSLMLYRPFLDQAAAGADSSDMGGMGRIGSMVSLDWGLKSHQVKDDLAIVSMGSTKLSIPMLGSMEFDGAKLSLPQSAGGPSGPIDFGVGLENPDRFGVAAVKDQGGWRVSLMDTVLNYTTLKANEQALAWGKEMYTDESAESDDSPGWDELPPLAQNMLGVMASFQKAVDAAEPNSEAYIP